MNICSPRNPYPPHHYFLIALTLSLCALVLGACRAVPKSKRSEYKMRHETPYQPTNVFSAPQIPENVRRVAILPINLPHADLRTSEILQYNAVSQAGRTNLFEIVQVKPDDLVRYVGKSNFSSIEVLPANFMQVMLDVYAADAILFNDITYYHAYQPIKIGLRAKLINVRSSQAIWAFDDIFDSGDPRVTSAALKYEESTGKKPYPYRKTTTVLQSPSAFSSYVFSTAYATMPQRNRPLPKVPEGYPRSVTPGKSTGRTPSGASAAEIPDLP